MNRASLEGLKIPGGVAQPGGRQEILGKLSIPFVALLSLYPPNCVERLSEKSLRGPQVALRAAQKPVSIYFDRYIRTKSAVGALLAPLFGQSRRDCPKRVRTLLRAWIWPV